MHLQSYAPAALTASAVGTAFNEQQCVVLRGAIDIAVAHDAFAAFSTLMRDEERLRQFPFDEKRKLGYTPPGIETLQRGSKKPDMNRAMFDFDPNLTLGEPSIAALYEETARAVRLVLSRLDEYAGTRLQDLPEGGHTLRTAQYLRKGTTPSDVLFPPHLDFSLLTGFIGCGTPGLEVYVNDAWHSAELDFGDVLVGIGTPLAQFHQELRPLRHRIVGGADYRLSSFLFFDLGYDVVLPRTGECYGDMLQRVLKSIRVDA